MRRLLTVVAVLLVAGCASETRKPVASSGHQTRIICITPCVNEPFFKQARQGAMDAAERMDARCEFVGTPAVDIPAQVQMVRKAVLEHYDGIAINIIDSTAFNGVIGEAQAQGIPVMAFNVNGQTGARVPTAAQNLYEAGRVAADAAAPLIADGSTVLITGHEGGSMSVDERYRGLFDGLKDKYLRYVWITTSGNVQEVESSVSAAMRKNPDAKTIIASGLSNAEGTGHAVERDFAGRGYLVVGFDNSPEVQRLIRKGAVTFTVDQQAYLQGFYPVMQLALAHQKGTLPTNVDAGAKIIRRADLQ